MTAEVNVQNFIGGTFRDAVSGRRLENLAPASGQPYGSIPDSAQDDVDEAVAAAEAAFPAWSTLPAEARSGFLTRLAEGIEARFEDFARAESVDTGKPVALARSVDIPRAIRNLRFFAGAVLHTASEAHITDYRAINYTLRRPRGVAATITPWNLPLYLFTWKVAPALATGNTVVGKPSEVTPVTAHMLCELAQEIGLPAGVLNVVHGRGPDVGAALVAHPGVPTVSFTGSTRAGRAIAGVTAPQFKKVALEMGGKNPNLIFADADLDRALEGTLRSSFANQGQVCLCGSRILVEAPVYREFLARLVDAAESLRSGDPADDGTQQGAVVSAEHLDKVESYVALAVEEGGTVRAGGRRWTPPPGELAGGYYYRPTVITGLGPECRVNQEEIFGPVVTVQPFQDEEEAVQSANGVDYGLSATVWTRDLGRAHRVAERLDAGTVWVNCWLLRDLRVPFGGMKASGVEREGGEEALRFFTEPKNVCIDVESS